MMKYQLNRWSVNAIAKVVINDDGDVDAIIHDDITFRPDHHLYPHSRAAIHNLISQLGQHVENCGQCWSRLAREYGVKESRH